MSGFALVTPGSIPVCVKTKWLKLVYITPVFGKQMRGSAGGGFQGDM